LGGFAGANEQGRDRSEQRRKTNWGAFRVYLAEIATPGHKGFYVSWQSASQQLAVMVTALLGVVLSSLLAPPTIDLWGWRIPFLVGCLIVPLL
jgi:MHS family citrate/tricarballylate:H+ symporter-like MFS transporter